MSEQQNEQSVHHHHAPAPADIYLYALMETLDIDQTHESAVSVTLMVGGGVVYGELISHGRWRAETESMVRNVAGPGSALLVRVLEVVDEAAGPRDEEQPLSYVHLRKARIVTNYRATLDEDVPQGPEFPLWRARLSDVQGWTLGRPPA